jgi:cell division protein FtsQ
MADKKDPADIEQYRLHKRRAGNLRWLLVAVLLLACAACGYLFAVSPFFGVEQVTISGNELLGAGRLRLLAGIKTGQNIFTVDTALVERWLFMEPLVESALVEIRLPRTVKITVAERQPVALIPTGQAFVQVDKSALVLRRMRELDDLSLPILSGVTGFPPGIVPGSRIEGKEMEVALIVLNSLPKQAFPAVKEVDVTDSQKIRLYTGGGVEVRVGGSGNMAEKYLLAESIIYNAQLDGTASQIGYIDVSSTEKPVVYYLSQ